MSDKKPLLKHKPCEICGAPFRMPDMCPFCPEAQERAKAKAERLAARRREEAELEEQRKAAEEDDLMDYADELCKFKN